MHPFEVLAQPIRRRIVEILASGEHTAGTIEQVIAQEYGVTRSATQHHLAYLLRNGWVDVRADITERWYRLEDDVIPRLRKETRRLRRIWDDRIGTIERRDPPLPRRFPRRQPPSQPPPSQPPPSQPPPSQPPPSQPPPSQPPPSQPPPSEPWPAQPPPSRLGYRGRGADPDDPWRRTRQDG
jgi:DNA-binding transcriptional ArsR family regulator